MTEVDGAVVVDDFGDEEADDDDDNDDEVGEEIFLGSKRKALIFKEDKGDTIRSYSSMRFARSSWEVIETKALRETEIEGEKGYEI